MFTNNNPVYGPYIYEAAQVYGPRTLQDTDTTDINWYSIITNQVLETRLKETNQGVNLLLYFICSIWICIAYVGYTLVERSATRPHNS